MRKLTPPAAATPMLDLRSSFAGRLCRVAALWIVGPMIFLRIIGRRSRPFAADFNHLRKAVKAGTTGLSPCGAAREA